MFENTFQGPGTGTYVDHTMEILLMLLVAFLLGLLLGYILWYKWHKLYQELDAEHNRIKAVLLELEKEHIGIKYKLEESEKDNSSLRRKIMSLEGDLAGMRFRLEKCESDMIVLASQKGEPISLASVAAPAAGAMAAPVFAASAHRHQDDLKKVEGIGPKIAHLLNENGIGTFAALAETSVEKLKEILDAGGTAFRMADPGTWPRQAAIAASGNWEELKAYQDELDGGKPS
jgi:predicted flap endonuclease-1-like 5' DNA nuclease